MGTKRVEATARQILADMVKRFTEQNGRHWLRGSWSNQNGTRHCALGYIDYRTIRTDSLGPRAFRMAVRSKAIKLLTVEVKESTSHESIVSANDFGGREVIVGAAARVAGGLARRLAALKGWKTRRAKAKPYVPALTGAAIARVRERNKV